MARRKSSVRRPRNSGSITYRKREGRYYVITSSRVGGKRVRSEHGSFATMAEAQIALDSANREGERAKRTRAIVKNVVRSFIEKKDGRQRAATTLQRYRGLAKNLTLIDPMQVEKLSVDDIEAVYADMRDEGLSETTVAHVDELLRAAFRWALRRKIISSNPFESEPVEKPQRRKGVTRYLRVSDREALLKEIGHTRYAAAIKFALATGLRRGEICGLRESAIDTRARLAWVRESRYEIVGERGQKATKSERQRAVPLNALALEALDEERERKAALRKRSGSAWVESGYAFVGDFGEPLNPYSLSNAFRHVRDRAGLDPAITLHSCRHTTASELIAAGVDVKTVQAILGHSDPSTTLRIYGHLVDGQAQDAMDRLDRRLRGSSPPNSPPKSRK